jgi:hypothetical protein
LEHSPTPWFWYWIQDERFQLTPSSVDVARVRRAPRELASVCTPYRRVYWQGADYAGRDGIAFGTESLVEATREFTNSWWSWRGSMGTKMRRIQIWISEDAAYMAASCTGCSMYWMQVVRGCGDRQERQAQLTLALCNGNQFFQVYPEQLRLGLRHPVCRSSPARSRRSMASQLPERKGKKGGQQRC